MESRRGGVVRRTRGREVETGEDKRRRGGEVKRRGGEE